MKAVIGRSDPRSHRGLAPVSFDALLAGVASAVGESAACDYHMSSMLRHDLDRASSHGRAVRDGSTTRMHRWRGVFQG